MRETAIVLTLDRLATNTAKTAHGLIRGPSRFQLLAVIDTASAGQDAGSVLDGVARGIPVFAQLAAAIERCGKPDWLVVGVATPGGVLPPDMRATLRSGLTQGLSVVSGMHEFLSDDSELVALAAQSGARLFDVRKPRPRRELHFWSGAVQSVNVPRIAVLGTDCALGKRTTSQALVAACRARGLTAEMIYTGQTGWLQGTRFGFVLDSTPNDFVSGELEHAIVSCARELRPDVMFLEGQSALRNPSGPCGSELLLSGGARGVILQHAPGRAYFDDQEELGNRIPSLASELRLIEAYGAKTLAIALNHEHLEPAAREAARAAVERETQVPAFFPLLENCDRIMPNLLTHLGRGGS